MTFQGAFSAEKEQENTENAKPVVQTKKRAEKLRKEREKKDRKEREKAAAAKVSVPYFIFGHLLLFVD